MLPFQLRRLKNKVCAKTAACSLPLSASSNSACFQLLVCQVYLRTQCFKQQQPNSANAPCGVGTGLLWKWILIREIMCYVSRKPGLALEMLLCKQGGEARKGSKCCLVSEGVAH